MNTTLHTLTGRNIQGVLLRPVNVHMAASLNRLQFGGVTKSRCGSFVTYEKFVTFQVRPISVFSNTTGMLRSSKWTKMEHPWAVTLISPCGVLGYSFTPIRTVTKIVTIQLHPTFVHLELLE